MRKTRKYKRRKRKRTRKKRGGMDPPSKLERSSSAPSATYATEEFPSPEEMEYQNEFFTPRAKDKDKAISIPKPRPKRPPRGLFGNMYDVGNAVAQFGKIVSGRANRGRMGGAKPAKAGISMCIWYGAGNKSTAVDRCDSLMKIGPDDPTYKKVFPVAIKKNWMGVPYLDDKFSKSVPTTDKGDKLPNIYNNLTPFTNETETAVYDAYYIIYEEKCGHGGERFELMKLNNVHIQNLGIGNGHKIKFQLWSDDMFVKQNGNIIDIKWGSSKYKRPVGTIWVTKVAPARRHTTGGKRKRKRRTKKRKRTRRRKKTRRRK